MFDSEMQEATSVVAALQQVINGCITELRATGGIDANQVVAYDLAHMASGVEASRSVLQYGSKGEYEARIALSFIADVCAEVMSRSYGREKAWGLDPAKIHDLRHFVAKFHDPAFVAELADHSGPSHLDEDFELVRATFARFAVEVIGPLAEDIHRNNLDVPENIISGLAEMGAFGLSIPENYGGFASGSENDYLAMVVATEELSKASLACGGSLITRPEILARALLRGGTERQKMYWLPKLANGEIMAGVAVTEPDFGSDVANLSTSATKCPGGWLINGVKTWCTFGARADVLMVLARTDPDKSKAHRGLSLFVVPKPQGDGNGFEFTQDLSPSIEAPNGRMEGRPIHTIGYRGMHSYEISIENWFVDEDSLVGLTEGLGKGFYYQMEGFENGRIQTAARAVGIMQAAYDVASSYAQNRNVFGEPIINYQLTKYKLGRMAAVIGASRQFSYQVASLMAKGEGALQASMVKAYVCRAAEWVTREAMQIHGGMGYAEEFAVSRYFVDARVLSIFEGADETLSLKVIARRLLEVGYNPH